MIRVLPAVPAAWADPTVHDVRTEGAFPLSAVRKGGATGWARLTSEAGAPWVVRQGVRGAIDVRDGQGRPLRYSAAGDGAVRAAAVLGRR